MGTLSEFNDLPVNPKLITNPWPPMERTQSGEWKRIWRFSLKDPIPSSLDLKRLGELITLEALARVADVYDLPSLSDVQFQIQFEQIGSHDIIAVVLTGDEGWWDCFFFFAIYEMFSNVDKKIGTIEKIENQERRYWRPWR